MTYSLAPLFTLKSVTGMAVRVQASMIEAAGQDMARYATLCDRLDVFMADPLFNRAEFNRLCRLHGLD